MFFEDFEEGQVFEGGPKTLDEDSILAFARAYDWQRFHTDPDAASDTPYGGLIASGYQTLLIAFAITLEMGLWMDSGLGSPGMDAIRWLLPVRPGDSLSVRVEVIGLRPSRSRPDRGLVTFAHTVTRADGEAVMTYDTMVMIARRVPDPQPQAEGPVPGDDDPDTRH